MKKKATQSYGVYITYTALPALALLVVLSLRKRHGYDRQAGSIHFTSRDNEWAVLEQRRLGEVARYAARKRHRAAAGPAEAVVGLPAGQPPLHNIFLFGSGLGALLKAEDRFLSGHMLLPEDVQQIPTPEALVACPAGQTCTFHIKVQPSSPAGNNTGGTQGMVFRARLFGNSIVPVTVRYNASTGLHDASYAASDPGSYIIEVYLGWMQHSGEGDSYRYDAATPPIPVGQLIFRSAHLLSVVGAAPASSGMCNQGTTDAAGRWVHMAGGVCRQPFCSGARLKDVRVSDELGLNKDFVWVPLGCQMHLYDTTDLWACVGGCGYRNWSFFGDSVGREQLQNIQLLATGFQPQFAMPKHKRSEVVVDIPSPVHDGTPIRTLWAAHGGDVEVLTLDDSHLLMAHSTLDSALRAQYEKRISDFATKCLAPAGSGQKQCFYYAPTTIQREIDWARSKWSLGSVDSSLLQITHVRQRQLHEWGVQHARKLGLSVLDGGQITDAHWWSSWDGLHYSEMVAHFPQGTFATNDTWIGGTSTMVTQVLLNHLCNRPCNPLFKSVTGHV
jgi:hypothetical protein